MDKRLLNTGESILVEANPHWSFLARPAAACMLAVALAVVVQLLGLPEPVMWIAAALLIAAVLYAIWKFIEWRSIDLVVTTDRLVFSAGVVAKRGIEIPLERINTVFFSQSIVERMTGSGNLTVESAGEGGQQHFRQVAKPLELQQQIYRAMEIDKSQTYDAMANAHRDIAGGQASSGGSIPQQIDELDQLRRRGILTDAEFQTKKAELLARM